MQHYIVIQRKPPRPKLSLGLFDEPPEDWERKARMLQIRRKRLLKEQVRIKAARN